MVFKPISFSKFNRIRFQDSGFEVRIFLWNFCLDIYHPPCNRGYRLQGAQRFQTLHRRRRGCTPSQWRFLKNGSSLRFQYQNGPVGWMICFLPPRKAPRKPPEPFCTTGPRHHAISIQRHPVTWGFHRTNSEDLRAELHE